MTIRLIIIIVTGNVLPSIIKTDNVSFPYFIISTDSVAHFSQ